jgi:hypothetical protein
LLSLEDVKAPAGVTISNGHPATTSKKGRPPQFVGKRNPKRDPVGVAHRSDDEDVG